MSWFEFIEWHQFISSWTFLLFAPIDWFLISTFKKAKQLKHFFFLKKIVTIIIIKEERERERKNNQLAIALAIERKQKNNCWSRSWSVEQHSLSTQQNVDLLHLLASIVIWGLSECCCFYLNKDSFFHYCYFLAFGFSLSLSLLNNSELLPKLS